MTSATRSPTPVPLLILTLLVLVVSASRALPHYEAPTDCEWHWLHVTADTATAIDTQVALHCHLRTINSQFDQTDFSVIARDYTSRLHIECSHSLLYLSALMADGLAHLHHLRHLTIEFCKLQKLGPGVFNGLRSLRNLAIRTHNEVWPTIQLEVSRDSLVPDVAQLERLDLSHNNMAVLAERLLCDLTGLQLLNVSHNRFEHISNVGLTEANDCATPLQVLDASHNQLSSLPDGGMTAALQLRALHVHHNQLATLGAGSLAPLDQLETLDLSVNALVTLPPSFFSTTVALHYLNLSNNTITWMPPGLFSPLRHLEVLLLAFNRLTSTPIKDEISLFDGLVRLVVLDLSHNALVSIDRQLLSDLYSLQSLDVEFNAIENVAAGAFASLSNLHTLRMSHNRLTVIDAGYLDGLPVLNQLRLDHNAIRSLHPDAFNNCSQLERLDLNGNALVAVPGALQVLTRLKHLDIGDNMIDHLESSSLQSLNNLVFLRLSGNPLMRLGPDSLPALSMLRTLDLSHCRLQSVERRSMDGLIGLELLLLDSNNLTSLEDVVSSLPSLVRLNVSDNDLRWFDYALLPTTVRHLDLHKNKIEELGNYLGLETKLRLETLDASDNRISFLGAASLPHGVRVASFSDNLISVIEPNTFIHKANLSRVDLYGNRLVTLNLNALRLGPRPEKQDPPEFYLGGNPFQCDCDMEWLQQINALNNAGQYPRAMDLDGIYCRLSYGRGRAVAPLVEASSSDFLCPYRSHCFALCHCCDFDACDCQMICPANCTCYHDQSWSTNVVDCSVNALQDIPNSIPMDATDVYLDGNHLAQLSQYAFIGKKNLETLLLNASAIQVVHNSTFSGLKRLLVLHLDHNDLRELAGGEFDPLESLRELYLQYNRLHFIHPRTLSRLKNLQVLDVSHNLLVDYQPDQLTVANPYLRWMALEANRWPCDDCAALLPLHRWLQDNQAIVAPDRPAVTCFPHGLPLLEASTLVHCQAFGPWILVSCLCVGLAVALLLTTTLLCWRRRRDSPPAPDDGVGEPSFDALVLYSVKDDALVKDYILNRLEDHGDGRRSPYQLCLQHRESCNLDTATAASRSVVILLTKNFMETEWGKTEVRLALRSWRSQAIRRPTVILVPDRKLIRRIDADLDLHQLLSKGVVINCSGLLFRRRLVMALPQVRRSRPVASQQFVVVSGTPLALASTTTKTHQRQFDALPHNL